MTQEKEKRLNEIQQRVAQEFWGTPSGVTYTKTHIDNTGPFTVYRSEDINPVEDIRWLIVELKAAWDRDDKLREESRLEREISYHIPFCGECMKALINLKPLCNIYEKLTIQHKDLLAALNQQEPDMEKPGHPKGLPPIPEDWKPVGPYTLLAGDFIGDPPIIHHQVLGWLTPGGDFVSPDKLEDYLSEQEGGKPDE